MSEKKNNEILAILNSSDTNNILKTIDSLRESGNDDLLNGLASTFKSTTNKEVRNKITVLFNDLKNQSSVKYVVEILQQVDDTETTKMLLSSCWQSRLDYSDQLEIFIDYVLGSSFETAFEAFTVIENIDVKISHNRKHEMIDYLNHNIAKCLQENRVLADDLEEIIRNYEEM